MMILFTLGYVLMGLIFLIVRLVYHILTKSLSQENLVRAIRGDCISLYSYAKQIVVSNPKKAKIVAVIMGCLIILLIMPLQMEIEYATEECLLSTIMFTMFLIAFAPKDDPSNTGFPVEIFGFLYSVSFMFYSASNFVIDIFLRERSSQERHVNIRIHCHDDFLWHMHYVFKSIYKKRHIEARNNFIGSGNDDDAGIYSLLRGRLFWRNQMVHLRHFDE